MARARQTTNVDIQEFRFSLLARQNFREALRYGAKIFHGLKKKVLSDRGSKHSRGVMEGWVAPKPFF